MASSAGESKAALRARLRAARRAIPAPVRAARAEALTAILARLVATGSGPVCAYVPSRSEPWSAGALEVLRETGREILLPVVPVPPGPLQWAAYEGPGALAPGPFGIAEPTGPRLGADAVSRATTILLPALAADRRGVRLGQGGGYYDRTLSLVAPGVPLVVVLNDEELVDELPAEPHDRRITVAALPSGLVPVGGSV
ncbi:5-formyltetrahydrofolate cyclo-ligase [Pseudonocardia humida]|uniref:5-formyltetrahydrofolate cyclo-ligase n=1 Tax=Pseudonocardia humida TaxID=2800819 RepID=A0ABT1A064_9PSEU|nr:5-formyltetrahydrofolate cyclo-ligase [Pseudonocardia humida]MCO1656385.1 5-formyltetrahydrofolate cyclo-ligase [Pseudonocardia humida]